MSELTAYHECGHALMAVLLCGEIKQVTIDPDNDDGPERFGDTQILWSRDSGDSKEFARKAVQVCLAGPVAEMVYSGDPWHPGLVAEWAHDWRQAWEAAAVLHADDRKRLAFLERVSVELHRLFKRENVWAALAALADHLLAHETMEGEEVVEIVGQWLG